MSFRVLARCAIILTLFVFQAATSVFSLVTLIIALLVNMYVSPRESYFIIAGVGLMMDLFMWRFYEFPTTIALLVMLKVSEVIMLHRSSGEVTIGGIMYCVLILSLVYTVPVFTLAHVGTSMIMVIRTVVLSVMFAYLLLVPAQKCGEWYRRTILEA